MFDKDAKFLIVDDVNSVRKTVKRYLKELGYSNFTEAETGLSAWNTLQDMQKKEDKFDLIISDWEMPELSGFDLLLKLRQTEAFKETPFLFITSLSDPQTLDNAVRSGANGYLSKPISKETLEAKLNSLALSLQKRAA